MKKPAVKRGKGSLLGHVCITEGNMCLMLMLRPELLLTLCNSGLMQMVSEHLGAYTKDEDTSEENARCVDSFHE